ncbi:MAG: hypothetical protein M1814_002225 [Vezdaea aestivalis]|nr:MAG: hypothetical protein M1814_002225 [Vezdaea aestivalis]
MSPTVLAPKVLIDNVATSPPDMEKESLVLPESTFPSPDWIQQVTYECGRQLPQTIAHRGFKARYPENTMGAFQGAVDVHAHAVETDIHLSKDGVVVISHDLDLKRCFGVNRKIIDCDWQFLSTVRTIREPKQSMPRLIDLLKFAAQPSNAHIWVLLDIKIDNNADDVMRLIGDAIHQIPPHPNRPWKDRIVLGCWTAKLLPFCVKYLPGYPITHIGFCVTYARQFLQIPNVSFNMLQKAMMSPRGLRFMRDVQKAGRPLFLWTVNEEDMMKWSIRKHVDGVITDDPEKFRKVVKNYSETEELSISWSSTVDAYRINFFVVLFGWFFHMRHGTRVQPRFRDGPVPSKR